MDSLDVYAMGKDRGQGIGAFIEIYNDYDKYLEEAYESEQNARQYSDFSFISHDINAEEKSEYLWEKFDNGIAEGFAEAWARRPADMRQDDIK